MFSQAVRSWSRLGSWNTMPNCLRTSSCCTAGFKPLISSVPLVGWSSVVSILMVVVLPGAVRPQKGEDLTGLHLEGDVVHGGEIPELLHYVLYPDHEASLPYSAISPSPFRREAYRTGLDLSSA